MRARRVGFALTILASPCNGAAVIACASVRSSSALKIFLTVLSGTAVRFEISICKECGKPDLSRALHRYRKVTVIAIWVYQFHFVCTYSHVYTYEQHYKDFGDAWYEHLH